MAVMPVMPRAIFPFPSVFAPEIDFGRSADLASRCGALAGARLNELRLLWPRSTFLSKARASIAIDFPAALKGDGAEGEGHGEQGYKQGNDLARHPGSLIQNALMADEGGAGIHSALATNW